MFLTEVLHKLGNNIENEQLREHITNYLQLENDDKSAFLTYVPHPDINYLIINASLENRNNIYTLFDENKLNDEQLKKYYYYLKEILRSKVFQQLLEALGIYDEEILNRCIEDVENVSFFFELPMYLYGTTSNYLRIYINIAKAHQAISNIEEERLIFFYLIVHLHEMIRYIRKSFRVGQKRDEKSKTPRKDALALGFNPVTDGGHIFEILLFGKDDFKKLRRDYFTDHVNYILNLSNWKEKELEKFRKDFAEIKDGQLKDAIHMDRKERHGNCIVFNAVESSCGTHEFCRYYETDR